MNKAIGTIRMPLIALLFVSNSNVAANIALPLVIPSPVQAEWKDGPGSRGFFGRFADGERLMIIYEQFNQCDCSLCGVPDQPLDTLHNINGLNLREYPACAIR